MKTVAATLIVGVLLSGCARRPKAEPAPQIVAIKAAGADLARLRAAAARCGAAPPQVRTVDNATFLTVGTENSVPVRNCFYARARADYRAHHPIRAWIEDAIG
jgi:hypothetical protein